MPSCPKPGSREPGLSSLFKASPPEALPSALATVSTSPDHAAFLRANAARISFGIASSEATLSTAPIS